jgi:hypothetical protein
VCATCGAWGRITLSTASSFLAVAAMVAKYLQMKAAFSGLRPRQITRLLRFYH